ncbi:dihydrofolate reductase family protein [Sphaerisporangium aureirubrum]|uniref:Dihydrofolate reductase family protein n=1 Tax=Sphaerisporangium aureirubrum TaxID=1544736 RepID=A0ABW1N7V7_9ACTN
MRKIVTAMSVSLDGFMEGPGGEIDWHMVDDELHTHFNEHLGTMSAFMNGRVSYELMEGFWPAADADPANPKPVAEFAAIWRDTPKFVYSRTLDHVGPNATLVRDVVPEEIAELKARPGGNMTVGGAGLVASFQRHDLIDEYHLYVHPLVLGAGKPLLPPGAAFDLELTETRVFGNGVVLLRYRRPR